MTIRKMIVIGLAGTLGISGLAMAAGRTRLLGGGAVLARMMQADEPNRPIENLIRDGLKRLIALRDELNVTDEQRAHIRQVVQSRREELVPAVKNVMSKRQALQQAVLAESPDEEAIRAAADELGKSIGEAALVVSKVAAEVKPILTEEQKQALRDFQAGRQNAIEKLLEGEDAASKP